MDHSISGTVAKAFGNVRARPRVVGVYDPRHGWVVQSGRQVLSLEAAVSLRASGATYISLKWKGRRLKLSLLKMDLPGLPVRDPAHRSPEQLRGIAAQSHWYATRPVLAENVEAAAEHTSSTNRQRFTITVTVEVEGAGANDRELLQAGIDALQSGVVSQRMKDISLAS